MSAFENATSSRFIQMNNEQTAIAAKSGADGTSAVHYQIPDTCLPKSYDGTTGRYIQFVGFLEGLPAGKKVTIRLMVNGQMKSERSYTSNGFICDESTEKKPPRANVKGGDAFHVEVITDAPGDGGSVKLLNSFFNTYSGNIEKELC